MGVGDWEERLLKLAHRQHGVVIREQAILEGAPAETIKKRCQRGTWKRQLAQVYQVDLSADEHLGRIHGAVLRTNGIAIRRTAARLFGMDAFDECNDIELACEVDVRFEGAHIYRGAAIPPWALTRREGIPTTKPVWTLFDLCRVATLEEIECAVDDCIRRNWTSFEQLQKAVGFFEQRGRPGVSLIRRIVELRAPQWQHTDSMLETLFLQVLRKAGLPKPVLQYPIVFNGRVIARADFAYPERRVLIETLGREYHRDKHWQLTRDCVRENAIELLRDYTVLKFTWDKVTREPETVVRDVAQALGIPIQEELRLLWWKRSA